MTYLIAWLFLISMCLHGDWLNEEFANSNQDADYVAISLGSNCHAAWFTRQFNIRSSAFPFDWCLTPFESLYGLIEHDFKDHFTLKYLLPFCAQDALPWLKRFLTEMDYDSLPKEGLVLNKKTGVIFNHDFANNQISTIAQHHAPQQEKYQRRIERFRDHMKSEKKIYLIRYFGIRKLQSILLLYLLQKKYPHSNFTLIVIGKTEEFTEPWNIDHLKNYCVKMHTDHFWQELCANIAAGAL